jgi:hypothetical protein
MAGKPANIIGTVTTNTDKISIETVATAKNLTFSIVFLTFFTKYLSVTQKNLKSITI